MLLDEAPQVGHSRVSDDNHMTHEINGYKNLVKHGNYFEYINCTYLPW